MSYEKIAPIVLYIIIGITIPIMILFFTADSLIDQAAYESKINKIENPSGQSTAPGFMKDLSSADSLSASSEKVIPVKSEPVKLTFLEKIVYYKTDIPLVWGYILLLIALITAIAFPIVYLFLNPANLVRSLLIVVGIAVLLGLAYIAASGSPIEIPGYTGTANTDHQVLKFVDAGLIFSYFMLGIALLSILLTEVINYFK